MRVSRVSHGHSLHVPGSCSGLVQCATPTSCTHHPVQEMWGCSLEFVKDLGVQGCRQDITRRDAVLVMLLLEVSLKGH